MSDNNYYISKPSAQELPTIDDRYAFIYVDRCHINVDGGSLFLTRGEGSFKIPSAILAALIIGPGSSITSAAMKLLNQSSVPIIGSDENEGRMYSFANSMCSNAKYAIQQARVVSDSSLRLKSAKEMYRIRFSDDFSKYDSLNRLRGMEGVRMKSLYKKYADMYNVPWNGRISCVDEMDYDDYLNMAITTGNQVLYSVMTAVVLAVGAVPSLGVIHNGASISFVLDIADLYKAESSIKISFENYDKLYVADDKWERDNIIRTAMRTCIHENRIIQRAVKDIRAALLIDNPFIDNFDFIEPNEIGLWNSDGKILEFNKNYGWSLK